MKTPAHRVLSTDDAAAVEWVQIDGRSDFLLTCDHASRRLPRALGSMNLSEAEATSHIAWDIGAEGLARNLAERLEAPLILQNYSRLVIDCNRPLDAEDSIPRLTEWGRINANDGLSDEELAARAAEIFSPYHDSLRRQIDQRQRDRRPTLLVAIHSFAPTYRGTARPWHIGLMYRRDARMARAMLPLLRRDERLVIGDNEPYALESGSDYTLLEHGEGRGIAHVGLEIRQDLIADPPTQKNWAGRLASLLKHVAVSADLS